MQIFQNRYRIDDLIRALNLACSKFIFLRLILFYKIPRYHSNLLKALIVELLCRNAALPYLSNDNFVKIDLVQQIFDCIFFQFQLAP